MGCGAVVRRGAAGVRDPPEAWRLWHPIDPSRADAALAELSRIGPRTVVWLNEAQLYLGPAEPGLGERVAAGLRELLRDAGRGPVLVLATLWPAFWDEPRQHVGLERRGLVLVRRRSQLARITHQR